MVTTKVVVVEKIRQGRGSTTRPEADDNTCQLLNKIRSQKRQLSRPANPSALGGWGLEVTKLNRHRDGLSIETSGTRFISLFL